MKMTQKEAVYQAVINVCGVADGAYVPTKEQRALIAQILIAGFVGESIELGADKDYDEKELKNYVSGLQSNWLRKDGRLNGNVKYVAKNPGSRAGQGDTAVKAMRMLLDSKTDKAERAEIQAFIDKRLKEVKPPKAQELTEDQRQLLIASGLAHLIPAQSVATESTPAAVEAEPETTKSDLVDQILADQEFTEAENEAYQD
jgi:hypothetical protein